MWSWTDGARRVGGMTRGCGWRITGLGLGAPSDSSLSGRGSKKAETAALVPGVRNLRGASILPRFNGREKATIIRWGPNVRGVEARFRRRASGVASRGSETRREKRRWYVAAGGSAGWNRTCENTVVTGAWGSRRIINGAGGAAKGERGEAVSVRNVGAEARAEVNALWRKSASYPRRRRRR